MLMTILIQENEDDLQKTVFQLQEVVGKRIPVSYTHLDVYKRQGYLPLKAWFWSSLLKLSVSILLPTTSCN